MSDAPHNQNRFMSAITDHKQICLAAAFIVVILLVILTIFNTIAIGNINKALANDKQSASSARVEPPTEHEAQLVPAEESKDDAKDEKPKKKKTEATPRPSTSAPPSAVPTPPPNDIPSDAIRVQTSEELAAALTNVQPGQTIALADGTYEGQFSITVSGTSDRPITLTGSPQAVIEGDGNLVDMTEDVDYTLYLNTVSYWKLSGFKIHGGQKGLMADTVTHTIFSNLELWDSKEEALHLRDDSTDNLISSINIHDTGKKEIAEGIYIGGAESNWGKFGTNKDADRSDRNIVENSTVVHTGGENVDIKEGTTGNILRNNHFDGSGQVGQYPDSCVDVKGQSTVVENNTCVNPIKDGFQVHAIDKANREPGISSGSDNTFSGNKGTVVIYDDATGNTVTP